MSATMTDEELVAYGSLFGLRFDPLGGVLLYPGFYLHPGADSWCVARDYHLQKDLYLSPMVIRQLRRWEGYEFRLPPS